MDNKYQKKRITGLIKQVTQNASDALMIGYPAVRKLALCGGRVVRPVLKAMHGPVPPGQHARDMVEALGTVLHEIAKKDASPLIQVLKRNDVPADPQLLMLVSALGSGRVSQVLEPLVDALRHPSPYVRWSAALALVQLRSKKAVGPLTEALRDRSPMVFGTVVDAMSGSKFYRNAAAIGPLKRIVARQRIQEELPGLWREAKHVLAILERTEAE